MLAHHWHASETPFNGVLLAGRCWPAYSGIWILPPLIIKNNNPPPKNVVKIGPTLTKNFLDPRMPRGLRSRQAHTRLLSH